MFRCIEVNVIMRQSLFEVLFQKRGQQKWSETFQYIVRFIQATIFGGYTQVM